MTKRLVSILGLGPLPAAPHYVPTTYAPESAPGQRSTETPLVQRALCDLDPDIASVVLLGTEAVKARWIDTGLARAVLGRDFAFTLLPDGRSPDERWQIFHKVARALRADALDGLEDEPPTAVVFDVTHGFRLQPMLELAALAFVRADEARDGFELTPIRVSYGAFEAKDAAGVAPIWDLTELLVAAQWNSAFDALLRYGRADEVHRLAIDTARRSGAPRDARDVLEGFAQRARRFADDLSLSRVSSVFKSSATALRESVEDPAFRAWFKVLPVLESPIETLRLRLRRLQSDDVVSREGLRAQAQLAKTHFETGQFAAAAVAIREGLVDLAGLLLGHAPLLEPGADFTGRARAEVENRLKETPGNPRGNPLERIVAFANRFRGVRNDILHGGRDRPREAPKLRDELARAVADFERLVASQTRS